MHSYSLFKQYLIVTVYCALHNFIHMYNQSDVLFDAWEEHDAEVCDTNNSGDARVRKCRIVEAFNQ